MTSFVVKQAARAAACLALLAPWTFAQAQVQAGPGTWSANQTWALDTANGGALTGYYYWPATPPVLDGKRALVLVLHGCAQTASGDVIDGSSDKGYNWKAAADQYGAVILAPNATGNLYGAHCWDWANTNRSRSYGHNAVLLDLINRFVQNPQYAIDPRQIYVAGLSSGGAQTMVLGCVAPDIFAGIGINAGPPPGVTTSQISMVPSGYTATTAANNCKNMSGSYAPSFATQIASVVWGTSDYTVAQAYGPLDAAAMRQVYGGSYTKGAALSVATGGTSTPYMDANGKVRTSEMPVSGLGHAWPAGSGGQNSNYVNATTVNYPAFVMDFWFKNNLRVAQTGPGLQPPAGLTVGARTVNSIALSWNASSGATGYNLYRNGTKVNASALTGTSYTDTGLAASTSYSYQVSALNNTTESALSGAVTGSTTSGYACTATTASNYAHVQAGRAHASGGYALANGSNQNMGLNNTFYTTTLAQTSPGYYVIGNCP